MERPNARRPLESLVGLAGTGNETRDRVIPVMDSPHCEFFRRVEDDGRSSGAWNQGETPEKRRPGLGREVSSSATDKTRGRKSVARSRGGDLHEV
jgi:hypothetical protein